MPRAAASRDRWPMGAPRRVWERGRRRDPRSEAGVPGSRRARARPFSRSAVSRATAAAEAVAQVPFPASPEAGLRAPRPPAPAAFSGEGAAAFRPHGRRAAPPPRGLLVPSRSAARSSGLGPARPAPLSEFLLCSVEPEPPPRGDREVKRSRDFRSPGSSGGAGPQAGSLS